MAILTLPMIALSLVFLFRFINKKHVPPIFGVYQQRNKYFWMKFIFMYIVLRVKQLVVHFKRLLAVELGNSYDGTVHIHDHDVALEQKHALGDYPLSVDAVYFNGMSKDGDAVICGLARRPQNFCDSFVYLKVGGEDVLLSPELPDSRLKQAPEDEGEYRVHGLSIENFIPMRTWKVSYSGEMKPRNNTEKRLEVTMDLTWSANWPAFNSDEHMSPKGVAMDMAREQWSRDYFKNIQKYHNTHYEQMGFFTGSAVIDGKEHSINMPCVRDHTFGKIREWRNFHRYVLHFIYLENGDCMEVGSVSQPVTLSHVTLGYLCRKSDQAVLPVSSCDFQLWQHGENQTLPKDYGFVFEAGGQSYDVRVQVNDEVVFYIGKVREAKLYERWCTVQVNGVKGWACMEWMQNNVPATIDTKSALAGFSHGP